MPTDNPTPQEALREEIDYNNYTDSIKKGLTEYELNSVFFDSESLLEFLLDDYNNSKKTQKNSNKTAKKNPTFFRSFSERLFNFLPESEKQIILSYNTTTTYGIISKDQEKRMRQHLTEQLKETTASKTIQNWFAGRTIPAREKAFEICFALNLDINATYNFLDKVCFRTGFNFHQYDEAIYYFCIKNKWTFKDAQRLIEEAKKLIEKTQKTSDKNITTFPFTSQTYNFLKDCTSKKDLLAYILEYFNQKSVESRTVKEFFNNTIKVLIGPEGYIKLEPPTDLSPELKGCHAMSRDYILKGIYGINLRNPSASKRTSPFPSHFITQFPNKDSFSMKIILTDKDTISLDTFTTNNDEMTRNLIILLDFYRRWMDLVINPKKEPLPPGYNPSDEVIKQINADLDTCKYRPLYPGNPYDLLFWEASHYEADTPMKHITIFRECISRIFSPSFYFDEAEKFSGQIEKEPLLKDVLSTETSKIAFENKTISHTISEKKLDSYFGKGNWKQQPCEICQHLGYNSKSKAYIIEKHIFQPYIGSNGCHQGKKIIRKAKGFFSNSILSPSLLAFILNKKYAAQLSLSQIEKIFNQKKINIKKEIMANWIINSSKTYFAVLFEKMKQELLTFPIIQTDKTIVYADNANSENNYYIQAYCSDEFSAKYPIVIYECHQEQNLRSSVFYTNYKGICVENKTKTSVTQKALEPICDGYTFWKIYNSKNGTYPSTVIYSLFKTANLNKLNTYDYFEYLLTELPKLLDTGGSIDSTKLDDLLPWSSNLPENCRNQTDWW